MRQLLIAGMVAGLLAALVAVLFARIAVEPKIDRAIAFETAAATARGEPEEPELVSRETQRGIGLLVATTAYGAAFGGLFALAFAGLKGRMLSGDARGAALRLAGIAFVVLCLVPQLKYPPNPPAVGQHDTIQLRTAAYFAMLAVSLGAALVAGLLRARLSRRFAPPDATTIAVVGYGAAVVMAGLLLPAIDEVPARFPASLLWQFRVGSLGTQALLWLTLGSVFGLLAVHIRLDDR